MLFMFFVDDCSKIYTERITGGALPCSSSRLISNAGNVGSDMTGLSEGRNTAVNGTVCTTRCATVIPTFFDSCKGQFIVSGISKFGVSTVEKETGDITNIASKIMWDKKCFMTSPGYLKSYSIKQQK